MPTPEFRGLFTDGAIRVQRENDGKINLLSNEPAGPSPTPTPTPLYMAMSNSKDLKKNYKPKK